MKAIKSVPYGPIRQKILANPRTNVGYLQDCLADGDLALFTEGLRHVVDARLGGIAELARRTKLGRETLYRTLSQKGNPRLDTLYKILDALDIQFELKFSPKKP